jgi:hypothetical protein
LLYIKLSMDRGPFGTQMENSNWRFAKSSQAALK